MDKTYDLHLNTILGEDTSDVSIPINTVGLNAGIRGMAVALEYIHFMNTIYPIRAGINDKVYLNENGTTYTATLTEGNYTDATLATELETQLNAVGGANTYAVALSSLLGKLTISITAGTTPFSFDSGLMEAYQALGAIPTDLNRSVSTSDLSLNGVVDVSGPKLLVIECQQLADYGTSRRDTNFLKQIPLQYGYGVVETWQTMLPCFKSIRMQALSNLTIRLRDENGNPFTLAKNTPIAMNFILKPYS